MKHLVSLLLSASLVSLTAVTSTTVEAAAQDTSAREHIQQGLAHVQAGDTMLAFAEFERAVNADPKSADAHYYIGRLYTHLASSVETDFQDRLKAEDALLQALRLSPSDPRYLLELGRLRLKQHMRVDAGRLFDRALDEAERRGDPGVLAEVHFNLGYMRELRYQALRNRRFTPFFRGPPVGELDYLTSQPTSRYANSYIDAAPPIQGSGQLFKEEMTEHYREALRHDPSHVAAAVRLMGELLDDLRLAEYLSLARRLREMNPDRPEPYLYLGLGLHAAGREDDAAAAFEEGLARLLPEERAAIENLDQVMRRREAQRYVELDAEEQAAFNDRFWKLSDPLYLTSSNERHLEHLARVAYADLRFSAPEAGLRGWETDRGIIYVRYGPPAEVASFAPQTYDAGNPYAVGRRSIIWSYGSEGPVFVFRQMPGYLNARFAGDYQFIADNYRYLQPAKYDNIPSLPELFDLPVQVTRFRGATPDEVAVEIHAAVPLVDLAEGLDLDKGELETGLFVLDDVGEEIVREVSTDIIAYAETPDLNEYRSWRLILPPGNLPLVLAVETRDEVTWRAAAARDTFTATRFPADSFAISDILAADLVRPLAEEPSSRSEYEILANAGLIFESGDPVHIYYEVYGLTPDPEGYASFDVSLQVRVKELHRGGGISALLGLLADAWGFSILGDDRLELRYSRQVELSDADRVTEYLSLDPQEVPAGEYEIRVRIWDNVAEQMAARTRTFTVIEEE